MGGLRRKFSKQLRKDRMKSIKLKISITTLFLSCLFTNGALANNNMASKCSVTEIIRLASKLRVVLRDCLKVTCSSRGSYNKAEFSIPNSNPNIGVWYDMVKTAKIHDMKISVFASSGTQSSYQCRFSNLQSIGL